MRTVAGHIPVRIIGVRVTPITVRQRYEPVARIAIRQVVSHRTRRRTLQRQDIAVEVVRKAALDEPVGAANALLGGELPARHPRDGRRGNSLLMLSVVVPMFAEVYARMERGPPALTRTVVALAEAFPACAAAIAALGGGLGALWYANRRNPA